MQVSKLHVRNLTNQFGLHGCQFFNFLHARHGLPTFFQKDRFCPLFRGCHCHNLDFFPGFLRCIYNPQSIAKKSRKLTIQHHEKLRKPRYVVAGGSRTQKTGPFGRYVSASAGGAQVGGGATDDQLMTFFDLPILGHNFSFF